MLTVQSLAWYLWLAMSAWVPPHHQTAAWREPEVDAVGRYWDVAEDIARVCLDPGERPLPGLDEDDDRARARTALLLASVGSYESAFADAVVTCRVKGPGGAVGPYQTHRAQARACTSVAEATRVALDMLRESLEVCCRLPTEDQLALYTDGRCVSPWPRSRVRVGRAARWWRTRPLAWAEELRAGWLGFD